MEGGKKLNAVRTRLDISGGGGARMSREEKDVKG